MFLKYHLNTDEICKLKELAKLNDGLAVDG